MVTAAASPVEGGEGKSRIGRNGCSDDDSDPASAMVGHRPRGMESNSSHSAKTSRRATPYQKLNCRWRPCVDAAEADAVAVIAAAVVAQLDFVVALVSKPELALWLPPLPQLYLCDDSGVASRSYVV